eukprot:5270668-Pleurochrysis_carterae.AAC.2
MCAAGGRLLERVHARVIALVHARTCMCKRMLAQRVVAHAFAHLWCVAVRDRARVVYACMNACMRMHADTRALLQQMRAHVRRYMSVHARVKGPDRAVDWSLNIRARKRERKREGKREMGEGKNRKDREREAGRRWKGRDAAPSAPW